MSQTLLPGPIAFPQNNSKNSAIGGNATTNEMTHFWILYTHVGEGAQNLCAHAVTFTDRETRATFPLQCYKRTKVLSESPRLSVALNGVCGAERRSVKMGPLTYETHIQTKCRRKKENASKKEGGGGFSDSYWLLARDCGKALREMMLAERKSCQRNSIFSSQPVSKFVKRFWSSLQKCTRQNQNPKRNAFRSPILNFSIWHRTLRFISAKTWFIKQ